MKRLSVFLLAAGLLFIAGSGFISVSETPFSIDGCVLNVDDLVLQLGPGNIPLQEPVNINVYVSEAGKVRAVGFSRLEILNLPDSGVTLRIALSEELKQKRDYQVRVVAKTVSEKVVESEYAALPALGSSSNSFFRREFNPMPEPWEMRNSIEKISPRTQMMIN